MLAEKGVPRLLFPPPELIADSELVAGLLFLLEGEPDTIRAWALGVPAVGVPGAQNWRDDWAARFAGRRWTVIVCFDCDTPGRDNARRAAAALAAAGVDVRVVDLDPDRDDGYDLTDWATAAADSASRASAASMLRTIAEATDPWRPPPEPGVHGERPWRSLPWSTFRDSAPPAHRWLIDGLLPAGALCFVAGPPKRGKTWLGIGTALALALGAPFAGDAERFTVPTPRDVLYIALEGSQTGLRTRIGALARGHDIDPDSGELDRLHMLYRPRPFDLAELATGSWLLDEAIDLDAWLVIVDVLRAAARFKENVAEDFARVRDHLEPLLASERTVMLLHHFGKLSETQKERSPGERMAGTGAMYGALDVGFLITRSSDGARRLGVTVEARDFAAPDALDLAIVGDGTGKHGGLRYDDTATLTIDETGGEDTRDYITEVEELLAESGEWRLARELAAKPDVGGIGANLDVLRDALEPALAGAPSRLVRLASGSTVGRSRNAQPYGTWAMYEALPEPRPPRSGSDSDPKESVESDRLFGDIETDSGSDSPPTEEESGRVGPGGPTLGPPEGHS